jgi:hypothetical protein
MTSDILLVAIAAGTSTLTAITGIGGGMMLIAIMPGFLPAAAIVPVHAAVQLFSNSSRAFFGWRFRRDCGRRDRRRHHPRNRPAVQPVVYRRLHSLQHLGTRA